ncbi:MAG TPA: oligosaccharide flippase family protein [Candidatus Saccharimonadales bacterium]|nr:oligosaccharide flippase family protein [Candidatus Saccharimonadales bacterium]
MRKVGILQTIKQSAFLRHNAIFMVGSVVVGALNYLYYPILGRLMEPSAFGEIQVLVSLFLQFTIFLNVLSLITVTITVNYKNKADAHRMIFELEKLAAYTTVGLLALSIIGGEFLRQQLRFDSMLPFVALALAMMTSVPLTFRSSFARGQKRFGVASLSQLIAAATKIVFSVGLVALGLGVTGAMLGIVVAQFVAFLYAARWAARVGFARPADTNYGTLPDLKLLLPELKYASTAFLGLLTITLFVSADIIIVKYFFDAHTAGLYAGIATVARIIYFLAVPIAQVLMPSVKVGESPEKNAQALWKSLLLTILASGSVLLVGVLWPEFIVRMLMGVDYITFSYLLAPLMTAIFVISVLNLIFMYYLALRKKTITLVGIIGIVATISLMLFAHDDLQTIVYNLLFGSIFTLIATGIYVLVNLKRGTGNAKQDDFNRYTDIQ